LVGQQEWHQVAQACKKLATAMPADCEACNDPGIASWLNKRAGYRKGRSTSLATT